MIIKHPFVLPFVLPLEPRPTRLSYCLYFTVLFIKTNLLSFIFTNTHVTI